MNTDNIPENQTFLVMFFICLKTNLSFQAQESLKEMLKSVLFLFLISIVKKNPSYMLNKQYQEIFK